MASCMAIGQGFDLHFLLLHRGAGIDEASLARRTKVFVCLFVWLFVCLFVCFFVLSCLLDLLDWSLHFSPLVLANGDGVRKRKDDTYRRLARYPPPHLRNNVTGVVVAAWWKSLAPVVGPVFDSLKCVPGC